MSKEYQNLLQDLIDSYGNWFDNEQIFGIPRMTDNLYPYKRLFSPIQVNRLKIKNRIVMGPMGNINMADELGRPSTKMIEYFLERAKGGTGLITTGLIPVNYYTDPSVEDVDEVGILPRIDKHRTTFSGWKNLAEGCHAYGSRIFIQLTAGFGRVGNPECMIKKFKPPVSSSWNRNFYIKTLPCRPLLDIECRKLIKSAGQAASDAKSLNIDGVYLHGHEGYLLEQMTNTAFNRRKHGKYADWQAFGIEMIKEIRRRCGNDFPIMYRIDLSLALNETYGIRMSTEKFLKAFKNERSVEMSLEYMHNLVKAGVDIFDVDLGCYENWWLPHPPIGMPSGCYLPVSKIVKEYFIRNNVKSNAGYDVPVVAVGKLGYPDLAEKALEENMCDMIMLARPLLADPYWPIKTYAGRLKEIIPCIGDQEGCLNQLPHGGHLQCAVNPRTAFEDIYKADNVPALEPKKIAVVGAGPAGFSCAHLAALRGHAVELFDSNDRAGGNLIPGSVPKIKYEVANYIEYMNEMLNITAAKHNLGLKFNTKVTKTVLKKGNFDIIVTCTGSIPNKVPVEGIDLDHVVQGVDLLWKPKLVEKAHKVVIIGGSDVGCEIAYWLAYEKGKQNVVVIEMLPHFMKGSCTANRGYLIHYLEKAGVRLMNCSTLKAVYEGEVEVLQNMSETVPAPYATWVPVLPENIENPFAKKIVKDDRTILLDADLVVLATGSYPNDTLYQDCLEKHVSPVIYNIGDSMAPGRVIEATKAGFALGRSL